jgi:hypothetical protein
VVNFYAMQVCGRESEREAGREISLYIGDNGRVESGEKENGCFILYNALIFKQRNEFSGDRK